MTEAAADDTSLIQGMSQHPVADLRTYHRNPRKGNTAVIAQSLQVNGQYRTLAVNRGTHTGRPNEVLAGNHTLMAARDLGWDSIAVTYVDVDDDQAARIVAVDNRASDIADMDDRLLLELLADLPDLDGTGYDPGDLAALEAALEAEAIPAAHGDPDAVPEPPKDPFCVLGDVWHLGPHRLAVGDSTDAELWERILEGDRPDLVFTDPPYGINYVAMRGGSKIANDGDEETAEQVTRDALNLLHDAKAHFVCCDWRSLPTMLDAMLEAAIEPKACIVWDKQSRVQNLDRYAKQHEFILYAGPYGGQPTEATDVWPFARDFKPDHPTPKPVELIQRALETASDHGALVADAFGGSGSTLIACHMTGRRARLVELDPKYADVICRRYQEHTGTKPTRDGIPHDFTATP
jgi:DNA modification methylase